MKKFIVTYHAPQDFMAQMANSTPEQREEGMKQWMTWAERCGDHMVDLGTPLAGGVKLNTDGTSDTSSREVCGYSVLQADSMDQAKQLLQGHPHLGWTNGCQIEVHESMPM